MAQEIEAVHMPATIERLVSGGWGLTRNGSLVTFVRGVLPGEHITFHSLTSHRGYQVGTLGHILEASTERRTPPCPVYAVCGGCHLQHARYETQLSQKQSYLLETLRRIGKINLPDGVPTIPSEKNLDYRSWIRFKIRFWQGKWQLGFFEEGSHTFVPASSCLLMADPLKEVTEKIEERLQTFKAFPTGLEEVEIRCSLEFHELLIIFRGEFTSTADVQTLLAFNEGNPAIVGVVCQEVGRESRNSRKTSRHLRGRNYIWERFQDIKVKISDGSFMQSNWPIFETIARTMRIWMGDLHRQRILELYAGTGCIGLMLARAGAFLTFVEANSVAYMDARKNASFNHIGRCRFRNMRAESFLSQTECGEYDVVIIDPPRKGMVAQETRELIRVQPPRIFYLSCDVPSLARDLGRLVQAGYRISRLQSFDAFPQTAHLETLVELVR